MDGIFVKEPIGKHKLSDIPGGKDCLTLKELCEELSISTATGRNWIKLGKLSPAYDSNNCPTFTPEYVSKLRKELESGRNTALKSRRNKKFIAGSSLYASYVSKQCRNLPFLQKLLAYAADSSITFDVPTIQLFVADCALHLFACKQHLPLKENKNLLAAFLLGDFAIGEYDELVRALIVNTESALRFCQAHPLLFHMEYAYEQAEDILGLIYISCKNIGSRKATGSYYTANDIVKQLIGKLPLQAPQRILDPCCGTGNFLLQLPEHIPFDSVYGNDIDTVSVTITRINMALKYEAPIASIYDHITEINYLTDYCITGFDYIIGNPPWGYAFSEKEKAALRNIFESADGKNIEAYDLFVEKSLKHLTHNGHLAFVLPETILNVRAHTAIREIILQNCSIRNLVFLGNIFDKVQCPCILLDLQYTGFSLSTTGMNVHTHAKSFTINTEREVTSAYFSFTASDEEYNLIQKIRSIENASYLLGNADFALGIVTGNNKKYISDKKTKENELVLKGADIRKYHINPATNYIIFKPECFQQTAPTEMYRAPEKLLYRFICNQLVFAYDDKQTLSLNSCNIVIPKIPGVKMKYVLAILNSGVAQFIYKREFHSVKVLRSHIESIPIPQVDEATQDNIIAVTDKLITGLNVKEVEVVYDELDTLVADVFRLNAAEREIIRKVVAGENRFLT